MLTPLEIPSEGENTLFQKLLAGRGEGCFDKLLKEGRKEGKGVIPPGDCNRWGSSYLLRREGEFEHRAFLVLRGVVSVNQNGSVLDR